MKPATPLPWVKGWGKGVTGMAAGHHYGFSSDLEDLRKDAKNAEVIVSAPVSLGFIASTFSDSDAEYIVHACNAYPKLVALVRDYSEEYGHGSFIELLRELGELE